MRRRLPIQKVGHNLYVLCRWCRATTFLVTGKSTKKKAVKELKEKAKRKYQQESLFSLRF
jgi:hypothetical protein